MLSKILKESFRMLFRRPRLFVPKLVSTFAASVFLVYLVSNRATISAFEPGLAITGVMSVTVVLSVMGIYSSMMLSHMVKEGSGLREAFLDVGGRQRSVIGTALAVVLLGALLAVIVALGYIAYLMTGMISLFVWAAVAAFLIMFASSYVIYFLPVTLLEEKNLSSAVLSSHSASRENRSVVVALLLFSLVLIALAFFSSGYLEKLGYIGFVVGRLVSSVVNTYLFVVSPTYYLESGSGSENVD